MIALMLSLIYFISFTSLTRIVYADFNWSHYVFASISFVCSGTKIILVLFSFHSFDSASIIRKDRIRFGEGL